MSTHKSTEGVDIPLVRRSKAVVDTSMSKDTPKALKGFQRGTERDVD